MYGGAPNTEQMVYGGNGVVYGGNGAVYGGNGVEYGGNGVVHGGEEKHSKTCRFFAFRAPVNTTPPPVNTTQ